MRLVIFAALLAACGGATESAACLTSCPTCSAGSICMTSGATGSTCVQTCQTSTDCPDGLQCAEVDFLGNTLFSVENRLPSAVCISASFPDECGAHGHATCSDHAFVTCLDSQHLATDFTWAQNESCGALITTCPDGCQSDADAGIQGVHAGHCL